MIQWAEGELIARLQLLMPALAVVVPAGVVASLGSFDGLYGQDSFAYYDYATALHESLLHGTLPPPFFWPPGYPLLVALISLLTGITPLAGHLVSLAAGGLVPIFTALLARELCISTGWGSAAGKTAPSLVPLLAGLVAGLTPQLWQSSIVVMADTTGLAAATLGIWCLARYGRGSRLVWLGLASGAIAWAVLTRWAYALVAIPAAIYVLVVLARRPARTALVHAACAFLVAAAILGPTVLPGILRLASGSEADPSFVGNLQIYTWHPLNALRREFVTVDGTLRYPLPNGLYYALLPAHWFYLTPVLAPVILPGLWFGARRRSALFALIVGWALVVYAFHAGAPWQNFRFVLAFLPPLAILVAIGFAETRRVASRPLRWIAGLALAAGLIWMFAGGVSLSREFIERKQADLATVHWVESQLPPEARLLTFNLTLTVQHYSRVPTLDLSEIDPSTISGLLAGRAPVFVLVDLTSIETQWADRSPFTNYVWLRDGPGLTPIGTSRQYTLFKVGSMKGAQAVRPSSFPLSVGMRRSSGAGR